MKVNEKIISTKTELLETIKQGVNILDYIKDERDIDFVTNAIVIEKMMKIHIMKKLLKQYLSQYYIMCYLQREKLKHQKDVGKLLNMV